MKISNFQEKNSGDYLCISNSSLIKNIYSTIRLSSLTKATLKPPFKILFNVTTRKSNVNNKQRPLEASTKKPDNENIAIIDNIQTSNTNILNNLPQQANNEIVFSLNKNSIHSKSITSSTTTTSSTSKMTSTLTTTIIEKDSNEDLIKSDDSYFEYCDNNDLYMKCYHGGKCFKTKKYDINHPLFTQFCM